MRPTSQWRGVKVEHRPALARLGEPQRRSKLGLQLDFNRYASGQKFLGMKSLVLDNLLQDPAMVRESVSMAFYARMGQPAPRESFCRLYINDVYQGVYALVEAITSELLARRRTIRPRISTSSTTQPRRFSARTSATTSITKTMFEPRSHQKEADSVLYGPIRDCSSR